MADGVMPDYLKQALEQHRLEAAIQEAVRQSVAPMLPPLRGVPLGRFTRFR